jgi:hypothetical protein
MRDWIRFLMIGRLEKKMLVRTFQLCWKDLPHHGAAHRFCRKHRKTRIKRSARPRSHAAALAYDSPNDG